MAAVTSVGAAEHAGAQSAKTVNELRGLRGLHFLLQTQRVLVFGAAAVAIAATALSVVPFLCVARTATAIYAQPPQLEAVRHLAWGSRSARPS